MQWKSVKSSLGNTAFGLWSNGQRMLTLAFKGKSDTIYLESEDGNRRLFHYRKKGLLKKSIVVENEYGVDLGKLKKEGNAEFIEVNDKRYFLNYKNKTHKEVEIIDDEMKQPVATCNFDDNSNDSSNHSLLLISCIYLNKAKIQTPVLIN